MAVFYLLPCSCGEKVTVGRRQAGQLVKCRCGVSLEVPTFAGLSRLQTAEPDPSAPETAKTWGGRQRLTLIACVILAAAFVLAVYLLISWPTAPPELSTAEQIERIEKWGQILSPAESWLRWESFHATPLDPRRPRPDPGLEEAVQWYRGWLGATIALAVCGAALAVAAQLIRFAAVTPLVE